MTTTLTSTPTASPLELAALHHPAAYASALDQISQTVHQLLLAALERSQAPAGAAAPARPMPAAAMPLSSRECEVLRRVAAGDSNKMIARALGLSPHTVKRHVANILDKLDLRSRGQAAAWWLTQHPRTLDA